MAPPNAVANLSRVGQTPVLWQGKCLDVWSPKWVLSQMLCHFSLFQKLCSFCLSQKLCRFCRLHSHLCRLVSEGSGTQDGSLTCSGTCTSGGEGALMSGAEMGSVPEAVLLL